MKYIYTQLISFIDLNYELWSFRGWYQWLDSCTLSLETTENEQHCDSGSIQQVMINYYYTEVSLFLPLFNITRPHSKQYLLTQSVFDRLGGWIDTTRHNDGIIYEHGPRSIRTAGPQGANTLDLIEELGLASKVRPISNDHPVTKNRLTFVDGKLHKLPSSVGSLFRKLEPFRLPLLCAGIKDLITPAKICQDDSLFNFVQRRFGADIAQYAIGMTN